MKWLLPIWNAFISINNDEAGPAIITKNNLELAEELKDKPPMNANEIKEYIKNKKNYEQK
jgi:hypothetical protein